MFTTFLYYPRVIVLNWSQMEPSFRGPVTKKAVALDRSFGDFQQQFVAFCGAIDLELLNYATIVLLDRMSEFRIRESHE